MESYHTHQLILPTDKRNPCITLYTTEDQQSIRVFYGLELMEVVPDDPDQMAFKMLAGRLYNAGVLVAKLEEVFKADRKTIRSWGEAIVSRDPERLARVLLGRGANQKRTPAIDNYVARRWPELRAEACPNYRATLIREIQSIFEVKLSGETIRQITLELKGNCAAMSGTPPSLTCLPPLHPLEEAACQQNDITTTDDLADFTPETSSQADCRDIDSTGAEPLASKCFPPNWQPRPGDSVLCDHVGMLIFSGALSTIARATSPPEPLLAQWLGSVMLGAVNIEQTKYLNWEDLGDLLGQTVRFPTPQREQLTRLATPATIDAVLRWNYQQLAIPDDEPDLYYDPHTTHYTGTQNILKGWCAAIRWADKLINSDYIHTSQGHPIYFECTDTAPLHTNSCAINSPTARSPTSPTWKKSKSAANSPDGKPANSSPPTEPNAIKPCANNAWRRSKQASPAAPPPPLTLQAPPQRKARNSPASTTPPNAMRNTASSEPSKSTTSTNSLSKTRKKNPRWKRKSRASTNSSTRKWYAWT
jgi:hypothetical protein